MSLTLEMRGFAPRTCGLISERSTIWPTSHVFQISRNFFSLSQQLWSFSFRTQKIYLLGISICNGLSGDSDYSSWVTLDLEMRGIDPRTSRMLSERSTIWATSPWFKTVEEAFVSVGKQEVKIFILEGIFCIRLYSVVFRTRLINCSMSLISEMRGIAPRTSDLISGRSTIWPTSHVYQFSRKFFRLVSNYVFFLLVRRKSTC